MFKLASLHEAYCLAKLQEATHASITIRNRLILDKPPTLAKSFTSYRGSNGGSLASTFLRFSPKNSNTGSQTSSRGTVSSIGSVTSRPRRILTPTEIDEKRANNMWFFL